MKTFLTLNLSLSMSWTLVALFFSLSSIQARGQEAIDPNDPSHISQSGQMFMVKIVPGAKETSLYVLGKKTALLKFDKLKVQASLFVGNEEKIIALIRKKGHFVTQTPLVGDELNLKLQSDENHGKEELRIKLKP